MSKLNWVDTQPLPKCGTGPDKRLVMIDADVRLPALYAEWLADACRHPSVVIVLSPDSAGRDQYYQFCEHCGLKISSAIKHEKATNVSDYDAAFMQARNEGYCDERQDALNRIANAAAERMQPENRKSYDDYLRSETWKRRAAKILERANGTCEGCLSKPATEVHHLTYAHVRNEFAFELVALCHGCHHRLHAAQA